MTWPDRTDSVIGHLTTFDLSAPDGFADLRELSRIWPDLSDVARRAWPHGKQIVPLARRPTRADVALLPGGAVALRRTGAILVCDPATATPCDMVETKRLRRFLRGRSDVFTLSRSADGVMPTQGVPDAPASQAVSIVTDTAGAPVRLPFSGPSLIQWGLHGAVVWTLVEAPALLALAATIAAAPFTGGARRLIGDDRPIAAESWLAAQPEERWRLVAAGLTEHLGEILAGAVHDDLMLAVMDACVESADSLAWRMADALALLPACFLEAPGALPGSPPEVWRQATDHIRRADRPLALLGLDQPPAPVTALRTLRETIDQADLLACDEHGDLLTDEPVPLRGDAALFLARQAGPRGRLGLALPTPAQPVELYTLAHRTAATTGARIIAAAPAWGFCHRVEPGGNEVGNANWYGMGACLDEIELWLGGADQND